MDRSALSAPHHDEVGRVPPGHLPGNPSNAPGASGDPGEGPAWGGSHTRSRGHARPPLPRDPVVFIDTWPGGALVRGKLLAVKGVRWGLHAVLPEPAWGALREGEADG